MQQNICTIKIKYLWNYQNVFFEINGNLKCKLCLFFSFQFYKFYSAFEVEQRVVNCSLSCFFKQTKEHFKIDKERNTVEIKSLVHHPVK